MPDWLTIWLFNWIVPLLPSLFKGFIRYEPKHLSSFLELHIDIHIRYALDMHIKRRRRRRYFKVHNQSHSRL